MKRIKSYIRLLKGCKTDKEIETLMNQIYSDGYTASENENKDID